MSFEKNRWLNHHAAAQCLQATARSFIFRLCFDRERLRARLVAYSKWTPVTLFHAYCRFAQQTTTARALKRAKFPSEQCDFQILWSFFRYLLHVSKPALHLLEESLDEASFICLCMDCRLLSATSIQRATSLFRYYSTCTSVILMNKLRVAFEYKLVTKDIIRHALESIHIASSHLERCLALFRSTAPAKQEVFDSLDRWGVFTKYRVLDQHGFEKVMITLAHCQSPSRSGGLRVFSPCPADVALVMAWVHVTYFAHPVP